MALEEAPKKVKVKKGLADWGLFADEDIKPDEFIIEYVGERISTEEADERGGEYLFEVTEDLTIDGRDERFTARYINHSCDPNAEAEHDEDGDRIYIRACKRIKKGEEITYNYGEEFFDEHIAPKGCRCASCRKR
jgi:SET domain-containing protein